MPFNTEKRSKQAKVRPRDAHGHFIPLKPKVKVSGQANALAGLIKTEKDEDPFNLITIRVGDSITKIVQILDDIRRKQATTVNMKFTIPLVVLPAVLLAAFTLGKWQSGCSDYFSSQVGTLQNITVVRQFRPDNGILYWFSYFPYIGQYLLREETLTQPVLVRENSESVIIENEAGVNLDSFNQGKVITFGNYNPCAQTLTLNSAQNISNY